jgi:hypothetical protein
MHATVDPQTSYETSFSPNEEISPCLRSSVPPCEKTSSVLSVPSVSYLTGIIKCAYGVPGNITYGTFVFVAVVG